MDEMSNRSDEWIGAMAPVHSNDKNSTEIVNKDNRSYLEDEGPNKNPRSWQECQHRENLRIQTMMLTSTVTLGRDKCETSSLEEKYTDMMIVAPIRELSLIKNELNSRGEERERMQTESIKNVHQVHIDQLLRSGSETDKFGTTVLFGAAGIGKSTLLQKIIHDWAQGRIYQEFKFVFQLNFTQLNSINVKTNLNTLILNSYPYLASKLEYIWEDPGSILFIFDNLDKFDSGVDFIDLERCKDPENQCFDTKSLHWTSDIARCLIHGYLLHGCSILVTSRPWKMGNLTKTKINLRGEILGFTSKSIKQYFRQCFADEQLATSVLESIQQNETLFTMCYNPLYCAVLSSLLTTRLKEREKQEPPLVPTSTEMFSAYIIELLARCHCDERNLCSQLIKIGEVAWKGVSSKTIVFDSDQINQQKLEESNCISYFVREIGESHRFAYAFNQSVLQDFIAAVVKCLTTSSKGLIRQLDEGFTCSDNRFEIFSRFLIGLLSHNSNNQLEKLLGDFPSDANQLVSAWLRDSMRRRVHKAGDMQSQRVFLQLIHCFVEFQDKPLISDSFQPLQSITFTQCLLKPSDCAALATSFVHMEQIEDLNFSACGIQDGGVHQLEPILSKCKILRLNRNEFGDAGINRLAAALKKHDCKIQILELKSNNLTDDCVEGLVSILSENGSLLELDLSNDNHDEELINKLTEKCIPSLYHLIKCKNNIKEIRLFHNLGIIEDHQVLNSTHLFSLMTDQDKSSPMEILHNHDTDSKDTTHVIAEAENPGLQENKHHDNSRHDCATVGDNVAAAPIESTPAGPELSEDPARQQGSPSENGEESVNNMRPNQFQQNALTDRELEHQEENAHMETILFGDSSNEDFSPTNNKFQQVPLGQEENCEHSNDRKTNGAEGDNNVNMSTLATMADVQQSKDAEIQQDNAFKIKADMDENKEGNAMTDTLRCKDNCNDIKPMTEANAESAQQPHPHGVHEKGNDVSENDNEENANLSTGADIPQSKDAEQQQNNPLEISTEDVCKNKEEHGVNETQCCKDNCNDIKPTDAANAYSTPQLHRNGAHENDKNVSERDGSGEGVPLSTEAGIQQSRDAELQKDKLLEISNEDVDKNKEKHIVPETPDIYNDIKSRNSMNGDSAPQPHSNGDQENSIQAQAFESPVLLGDSTDVHMCEEFRNTTTDSASLLHNRETQDSVNIQSPQKPLQDELQVCREGHVRTVIPLFSTAKPQQDLGNVKSTPICPSPVRNPRPIGLLQEENISIGGPSINMLPDGMSIPFGTAVKAKGPGAVENSDNGTECGVLHGDSTDTHECEEFRNTTTDSASLLHNRETQDSVIIQSPQKSLQDELQICREGHIKTIIPLFSTATPQQELGNVKSTPTCPSPVRNPRPVGLLQEENISIGGPSINMFPDGMSIPFGTAVKAKGPGAVENSDNGPDIPGLHGDSTDTSMCEELRNMTTDSASLLHNRETQDSVNIQSPQKLLQDELQVCREGHVKTVIPLFSSTTSQQELDNVKTTPTCPSPVRNPRPIGLLQEEIISVGGHSSNTLPGRMSISFGTAVKAKGPGADIPLLHGDFMHPYTPEESRNMTTDSSSSLHNGEIQDDVNIKSPQKLLQDELQICRKGHVKSIIPLLSNAPPQPELDNEKITPASSSLVRDPTPTSLLQEEKVSDSVSSNNMPPDGRIIFFDRAGKAKGPGAEHVSPVCAHVMDQNADGGSMLNEFLRNVSEYDLQALTAHFKQRLKDAVDEFGQQLVVNLLSKKLISEKECEISRKQIKEKCNSEASKFIFDKVRTIGFVAVKAMWEICVNIDGVTPKLNEIRNDLLKKVEEVKLNEFLRNISESDLQDITADYRKSLEDAIDEFGQHVALNLLKKCFISDKESEYMRKMIHEKGKSEAFQLILDKVTVSGIGAMKIMWETCLKMNDMTPKLSKIRNDLLKQVYSTHSS